MRFLPLVVALVGIVVLLGSLGSGSLKEGLRTGRSILLVAAGVIAAIVLLWFIAARPR